MNHPREGYITKYNVWFNFWLIFVSVACVLLEKMKDKCTGSENMEHEKCEFLNFTPLPGRSRSRSRSVLRVKCGTVEN